MVLGRSTPGLGCGRVGTAYEGCLAGSGFLSAPARWLVLSNQATNNGLHAMQAVLDSIDVACGEGKEREGKVRDFGMPKKAIKGRLLQLTSCAFRRSSLLARIEVHA